MRRLATLALVAAAVACASPPELARVTDERPRSAPEATPDAPGGRWRELDLVDDSELGQGCAVESAGALWCWGPDPTLHAGVRQRPPDGAWTTIPTRVEDVDDARAVAVGESQVCRIDGDGGVRCLGEATGWTVVAGVEAARALAVAGARGCALQADATLRCWQDGEASEPVSQDIKAFAMSGYRDCMLRAGGEILRRGSPTAALKLLTTIPGTRGLALADRVLWIVDDDGRIARHSLSDLNGAITWEEVDRIEGTIEIAAARNHTCIRTAAGAAWCRGRNSHGQLGDAITRRSERFVPFGDRPVDGVALGALRTCVRGGSLLVCVGLDAMEAPLERPPTAAPPRQYTLPDIVARALAASDATSCGLAVDDRLRCWGSRAFDRHEEPRRRDLGADVAVPGSSARRCARSTACGRTRRG